MDVASEMSYPTPLVNSTLLPMLLLSLARQKHTPNTAKTVSTEYDYVIVGAGSAGSVLANRLSEMPCVSILLLEAGGPPPLLNEVPGIGRFFWYTNVDWAYKTAPQKHCGDGLNNRQVAWPSGKALGGSTVLNNMLYVRGNRKNYDDWANDGAEGWSYKDVFPYFKKLEDNRDPEYVANGFHGVGGPQTVHRPRYQSEIKDPIFETAKDLGYRVVDPNGARQTGFYDFQATMRAGQRCTTAKSYLVPAENRTNLDILPNAMVRKVVIRKQRAVGVRFDFQGVTYEVGARREVIMSAGTVNTAQLLMLSGIGPRKELERFKIPVIADLPVGRNLQDHCASIVNFNLNPNIQPYVQKLINPANIAQYIQNRTGPLGSCEVASAAAFLSDGRHDHKKDFPNFELYFSELTAEAGLQLNINPETYSRMFAPLTGKPFYACAAQILQPRSRGTVTLRSTDPLDPPVIDPNYYEDPKDIQDVVDGLKVCLRIGNSPHLREVGSTPVSALVPGCEKYAGDQENYLWCLTKSVVFTLSHPVGTARMGHPEDPRSVVDPQLRVKHIRGLRVVDASVMPIIPSGNTNIPTIMVAEKASDIIKETIHCPHKVRGEDSEKDHSDIFDEDLTPADDVRAWDGSLPKSEWVSSAPSFQPSTKGGFKRSVPKVTPWNKEIPNVVPWNQELIQAFIPNQTSAPNIDDDEPTSSQQSDGSGQADASPPRERQNAQRPGFSIQAAIPLKFKNLQLEFSKTLRKTQDKKDKKEKFSKFLPSKLSKTAGKQQESGPPANGPPSSLIDNPASAPQQGGAQAQSQPRPPGISIQGKFKNLEFELSKTLRKVKDGKKGKFNKRPEASVPSSEEDPSDEQSAPFQPSYPALRPPAPEPPSVRPPLNLGTDQDQVSGCDLDFCRALLDYMQCQHGPACAKRSEFANLIFSILCAS